MNLGFVWIVLMFTVSLKINKLILYKCVWFLFKYTYSTITSPRKAFNKVVTGWHHPSEELKEQRNDFRHPVYYLTTQDATAIRKRAEAKATRSVGLDADTVAMAML